MPPKTRTWYDWPRWRMPRRSFARGRRELVGAAMRRAYGRNMDSGMDKDRPAEPKKDLVRLQNARSHGVSCLVRRQGLEPRTRGLRVRCSAN
jgi:hypothetical protein